MLLEIIFGIIHFLSNNYSMPHFLFILSCFYFYFIFCFVFMYIRFLFVLNCLFTLYEIYSSYNHHHHHHRFNVVVSLCFRVSFRILCFFLSFFFNIIIICFPFTHFVLFCFVLCLCVVLAVAY